MSVFLIIRSIYLTTYRYIFIILKMYSFIVLFPGNIKFCIILNLLLILICQENCPCLETLDLSNSRFSTDYLILNVEKLQVSCPAFKILRLANCRVRANQVSQKVQVLLLYMSVLSVYIFMYTMYMCELLCKQFFYLF